MLSFIFFYLHLFFLLLFCFPFIIYFDLPSFVCSPYSTLFLIGSAYALIMLGFIFSRVDGSAYALMVPGYTCFLSRLD